MDFSKVSSIVIPEGNVISIAREDILLWKKSMLPTGYTQIEYVKTNGTQWIDTGINGQDVIGFDIKAHAEAKGTSNTQVLGGDC